MIKANSIFLAPMAGVTDAPFRRLCASLGADFTVSEMISAKGVALCPFEREEVRHMRQVSPGERCFLQLFGSDEGHMATIAARFSDDPHVGIDINMGCPAPKIVKGGDGSALLKNLPLAEQIVRAVVRASSKPVSVKMRLGWDEQSIVYLEAAKRFEDAGAAFITLHGRTTQQMYSGQARLDAIATLAQALRIPVVGNGDIFSAQDALHMLKYTGCRGVMVGRGSLGNPWIFAEIQALLRSETPAPVSLAARLDTALAQAAELAALKGENMAVREMRKHMAWYTKGLRGGAAARVAINACQSLDALAAELSALLDQNA